MKKIPLSKWTLLVTMVIMTLVSNNLNWTREFWKGIVKSDAKGYFAYLPATFVHQDLNYTFYDSLEKGKYYDPNFYFDYRFQLEDGRSYNKYFCGSAVAMAPFYLIGHVVANAGGYDVDGYSSPYVISVTVAALFYLFLGLLYLQKTLTLYEVSERNKSLVLLAATFGTNLFYYSLVEPGLSHIYSFAFVAMFLYFAKRYFGAFEKKAVIFMAISLAMVVLIRPVNGLIVLSIPFFAGSFDELKNGLTTLFKSYKTLLISVLIGTAILSLQLIVYKLSTGRFFFYSYGTDHFNFLEPHLFDMLFSYKKGLFLYTPMYFIAVVAAIFLWKTRRFEATSFLIFFLLITYVLSSWWQWYYGGSFSSRVYVEYLPLFMIVLGISLQSIQRRWAKISLTSTIFLLVVICQIQTYQYRYEEIHWSEMTKDRYWNVFLRIDRLL